jgi:hypothetical protein
MIAVRKDDYDKLREEHQRMKELLIAARGWKNAGAFAVESPAKGTEALTKAQEKLERVIGGLDDLQL